MTGYTNNQLVSLSGEEHAVPDVRGPARAGEGGGGRVQGGRLHPGHRHRHLLPRVIQLTFHIVTLILQILFYFILFQYI